MVRRRQKPYATLGITRDVKNIISKLHAEIKENKSSLPDFFLDKEP
jgi:hypothetical protein